MKKKLVKPKIKYLLDDKTSIDLLTNKVYWDNISQNFDIESITINI